MNKVAHSGLALWGRALEVIPGGNGLLSKRPDRYAPDLWPTYFTECKGVEVTDLQGNVYIDMAQMGLGSAILGYADPELTEAVCATAKRGVNCTLNCPEEVSLAELLLELNLFAGGVRFTKTGAEAMSMAVRIGRAFTGREKVAFSGYHGWSDWYLAANLTEDLLADHLLPGLEPKGVPASLKNTALPFAYNDVQSLKRLVDIHPDIGVICIEGARYDYPNHEFLDSVRNTADRLGAVVVSDEITSGWRITSGGVYKVNGFDPDIVVYGKAMGGGYPIAAVVGRKSVMGSAHDTFMSSTMWTERIGFSAALTTIGMLTRRKGWEHLIKIGIRIGNGWNRLAKQHGLELRVTDFEPLITFKLNYGIDNDALVTLFTQEMLKHGYLAAPSVYVSLAHTTEIVDQYLEAVDQVFGIMANTINSGNIRLKLNTRPRSDAFVRFT